MTHQSEQILENNLVEQLQALGYSYVAIKDEDDLLANLKKQIEKHNNVELTDNEFKKVLNHLNKGNVFERAKILRDRMQLTKENGDSIYLEFMQLDQWCQNQFQVTNQVTVEGSYKNRYDVTILVNGLPLVQIELKRRGLELKEAFNQINRYQRHSYWASNGLFQYIQIFVISNGVNTKYYANNRYQSFKQTFFWSDKANRIVSQLKEFTNEFLEPCHISKMIAKYVVIVETQKILMVLRPYQYYATEAIVERVKTSDKNGYIWHTTGSGKTLTSFKASQVLMRLPKIHKVVFVVDRRDLDYQTIKEFNSFSKGSVDATDNTKILVKQLSDDTKLIVTTIQKLNNAISNTRYLSRMNDLRDKKIVLMFDECHRNQFGETHRRIKNFFTNAQMFGFTGTPIFAENAFKNELGKRTTKELFDECLHKYVITDAIKDENVLKFQVEYIGRYKEKEGSNTNIDIEVEAIDTQELLESHNRLEKIVNYIIANHNRKTHSKEFTGMFCVSSISTLIKYYEIFKQKKDEGKHNLRIATIFSYTVNEEDEDANGFIPEELPLAAEPNIEYKVNKHTRDKLEEFIGDYNEMFGSKYTAKNSESFYNYYKDIAKRVKNREVDILLVVSMFLTGFDSKPLNTLYVDKNLKYHGLIQAYSRTNRILNEQKSQGNIVSFRNLKKATDDAVALFSNKDAHEEIFIEPYEEYVKKFNIAYDDLLSITPTVDSVNDLISEIDELKFIKAFRILMRIKNVLVTFTDFTFNDLAMNEQAYEDYKSKYLDLWDKVKSNNQKEKVSILDDVDFELELLHRDEINVAYIIRLLIKLKNASESEKERQRKQIEELLSGEAKLRSKRELIQRFIEENLPHIDDAETLTDEFESFWKVEQKKAFDRICLEERLNPKKLFKVIDDYIFSEQIPLRDEIVSMMEEKPKLLERASITERIINRIVEFVEVFINGMGD